MKIISKETHPILGKDVSTEDVKDAVFLKTGKHLIEEEAEKILNQYEYFIQNEEPLSLFLYIYHYYKK